MVTAEPPKMAQLQLRQLALPKTVSDSFERTCFESLPRNLAESLPLPSLSFIRASLTLHSLSLPRGNFESLTLHSLSLIDENRSQRISFKEVIFGDGSLQERAKNIEHKLAERRAGTNSFSNLSFQEGIATREAGTNSFSTTSFLDIILSLRMWLQIFLLSSLQLTCAALLLGTSSVSMSFRSFSQQLCRNSFQSTQLCRGTLDSLILQLDLVTSLSLTWFGSTRCRQQLQSNSLDGSSFEHRALPCAALLDSTRSRTQLKNKQVQSFQLTRVQLCSSLAQGGAYPHRALSRALGTSWPSKALTLISLSFALMLGSKLQATELGEEGR